MSDEPVGSAPRRAPEPQESGMKAISGNSHKSREADETAQEPREVLDKVVEGKVIARKVPWYKKLGKNLIADGDAHSIGDYILSDVVIPATRNLIADIVGQGINRVLYGDRLNRRGGSTSLGFSSRSLRNTPYDKLSSGVDRDRRVMSRESRARHDFDEIVLESRTEAIDVIDALIDRIDRYRVATVADLYDFVGTTGSYADQRWGWTDLITANVRQVRGGFLLDLPQPEPIR